MTLAETPNFIGGGDPYDPAVGIPSKPIAGNTSDDDGEALDAFFQEPFHAPQVYGIPDVNPDALPVTQRLLSKFLPIGPEPVNLLPADPNRKALRIIILHGPAVVQFQIADTQTSLNGSGLVGSKFNATAMSEYVFHGYTGAMWIRQVDIGADFLPVPTVGAAIGVSVFAETC